MAAGGGYCCGPPQINERMENTGGCLWECRQFSSTQNEPYETCRARRDFPLVYRSWMVSLSRADNTSVRDNNIYENKNVSPNILWRRGAAPGVDPSASVFDVLSEMVFCIPWL